MSALLLAAVVAQPVLARPTAVPAVVLGSHKPTEEVQLDLSPGFTFDVHDLGAGAVAARLPFLVALRHIQLAPGKALRISVSLDPAAPPGTRLSFQPGASNGGTCRAGSLLPGASVQIFESTGGAVTGSCELRWSLDSLVRPRQAGSIPLTLRWKLESVVVSESMARAPGTSGGTAAGTLGAGSHLPASPAAGAAPRGEVDRPERRRPPG
jgi:hypothetical protein